MAENSGLQVPHGSVPFAIRSNHDAGCLRAYATHGCTCEAARDEAVRVVDGRHGYTVEQAPYPDAHRAEYDEAEASLRLWDSV